MHDGRTNGGTNFGLEFLNEARQMKFPFTL
jgi:hypothetical protein